MASAQTPRSRELPRKKGEDPGNGNYANFKEGRDVKEPREGQGDPNRPEPRKREKDVPPAKKDEKPPLPPLDVGTRVKGRWELYEKIGHGAFGEIYKAMDLNSRKKVAVKVERWETKKSVLHLEVAVLKKVQNSQYVARYVGCGRSEGFNFLVMQLLGTNLSELRRSQPHQKFTLSTTCRLGIQMLYAVGDLHEAGYLHRDIKPSNFSVGLKQTDGGRHRCYMFDFGLARKYRNTGGELRPARSNPGFRGTARYASIAAHDSKELGRVDDLWCIFYLLVEFISGGLPWRKYKEKDEIGKWKKELTNATLVASCPPEMLTFMNYLKKLESEDEPDYEYIRGLFHKIMEREGIHEDDAWDWDESNSGSEGESEGVSDVEPTPLAHSKSQQHGADEAVSVDHVARRRSNSSAGIKDVADGRARLEDINAPSPPASRDRREKDPRRRPRSPAGQLTSTGAPQMSQTATASNTGFLQVIDIRRGSLVSSQGAESSEPALAAAKAKRRERREKKSRGGHVSVSPVRQERSRGDHSDTDSKMRASPSASRQRHRVKRSDDESFNANHRDRDRSVNDESRGASQSRHRHREGRDDYHIRDRLKERERERELLKSGYDKVMGGRSRGGKERPVDPNRPPEIKRGPREDGADEGDDNNYDDAVERSHRVREKVLRGDGQGESSRARLASANPRGRSSRKARHSRVPELSGERAERAGSCESHQAAEEEEGLPMLDAPAIPLEPQPPGQQFRSNKYNRTAPRTAASKIRNGTGPSDLRLERDITARVPTRDHGDKGPSARETPLGSGTASPRRPSLRGTPRSLAASSGNSATPNVGELREELVKQNEMAAERIQELERQLHELDATGERIQAIGGPVR